MENEYIRLFCSDFIAVYRPNKSTYSILKYIGNVWKRHNISPGSVQPQVIYEQDIPPAPVKIAIDSSGLFVHCTGSGEYLLYENKVLAIIRKMPNSVKKFPQSYYSGEFTVNIRGERENDVPLWTLFPAEPVVPPPSTPPIDRPKLPQHIAWIIAEDACKNNQSCSITLNPISPTTASVTNCFHVFETEAIHTALQVNARCPVCRAKNPVLTACFSM